MLKATPAGSSLNPVVPRLIRSNIKLVWGARTGLVLWGAPPPAWRELARTKLTTGACLPSLGPGLPVTWPCLPPSGHAPSPPPLPIGWPDNLYVPLLRARARLPGCRKRGGARQSGPSANRGELCTHPLCTLCWAVRCRLGCGPCVLRAPVLVAPGYSQIGFASKSPL